MGNYNLISSSCQTFCDKFLKNVTGKGYNTYMKKAGILTATSLTYGGLAMFIGALGFNPVGVAVGVTVIMAIAIGGTVTD